MSDPVEFQPAFGESFIVLLGVHQKNAITDGPRPRRFGRPDLATRVTGSVGIFMIDLAVSPSKGI